MIKERGAGKESPTDWGRGKDSDGDINAIVNEVMYVLKPDTFGSVD